MNTWMRKFKVVSFALMGTVTLPAVAGSIQPISPEHCDLMHRTNVITGHSPMGCERLRKVSFTFRHFDGSDRQGSVVVMDAFASHARQVFKQLHRLNFPMEQARGLEHFLGKDEASMQANNTSAFNGRPITGGTRPSLHAYGAAIDLNPVQNPFLDITVQGSATIAPLQAARSTVNRMPLRPNKARTPGMAEEVVDVFADNGFIHWGGYWNYPIDYQHFEVAPRVFVEYLAQLDPLQAKRQFRAYVDRYRGCLAERASTDQAERRANCVSEVLAYYAKQPWLGAAH